MPDKVTQTNHWEDKNLLTVASPLKDYKLQVAWSEGMSQFNTKQRLFESVILKAEANEKDIIRRKNELESLASKPKRGTY